jgi:hypothetical protein
MSIREEWIARVGEGKLLKLGFLIPGPPERRTVLMSAEINNLVSGPWGDVAKGDRCARLRANLENIVSGARLTVCWEPFKGRPYHQIGRLSPPQDFMFDIRCGEDPTLRVTFHFAERDVLVTHLCSPRSYRVSWLDRLPLGDRTSREWRSTIMESNALWRELFPGYRPHSGDHIDDLLSNADLR